jgi:hypothetical protein
MMAQAGVIHIEAKTKGKGHLYRLTTAGEDFRPIVELLSIWGRRWGQGLIGPDDLDPGMLVWGMRGNASGWLCHPLFSRHTEIVPQPSVLVVGAQDRGD